MTIKNWFVRSERVKDKHNGIIKYGKYLIDSKHPNHSNTTAITPIYNNIENFIRSVSNEAVSLDMGNSQKKGGGQSKVMPRASFLDCLNQFKNQRRNNGSQ